MKFDKKAVSPLIATVLLVLIVITIGAAVMLVLKGLTGVNGPEYNTEDEKLLCKNVNFEIHEINGEKKLCHDSSNKKISLFLRNIGGKEINDLKFTLIGNQDIFHDNSYGQGLSQGEPKSFEYVYTAGIGSEIEQISIIPVIKDNGRDIFCYDNEIVWEGNKIPDC